MDVMALASTVILGSESPSHDSGSRAALIPNISFSW
jgi:hypothetical protein